MSKKPSLKKYIFKDKKMIVWLFISGTIFNVGLVFFPIFEGLLAQQIYDIILGEKIFKDMLNLVMVYFFSLALVQVARHFKRYFARKISNQVAGDLRKSLYTKVVKSDKMQLKSTTQGELVTRAVSDISAVSDGIRRGLSEIFDTGILLISYGVVMLIIDYKLAIISLLIMPVACVFAEILKKFVYSANYRYKKSAEKLSNETYERVKMATLYRVYGRDKDKNSQYDNILVDYEKNAVNANVWENTLQPVYNVIAMAGIIFVIIMGARNVLGTGWSVWDIALFTSFISCYTKLADKSSKVAKLFNSVQRAKISWLRLRGELDVNDVMPIYKKTEKTSFELNVKNLSVSYGSLNLFKNVNFNAKSGQIIGVTGAVASGKTALSKVFLKEVEYGGEIKLNKKELESYDIGELYSIISYHGHSSELFSMSIKDNVCLGSQLDAEKYLKMVKLDKEIEQMPQGVDSLVGSSGLRLSGGQKQRVALARTFLHAKKVLILDEPFASLDKNTENEIFETLKKEFSDRLIIVFTHRLSKFPSLDGVLFLDKENSQFEKHEKLYNSSEKYRALFDMQGEVDYE